MQRAAQLAWDRVMDSAGDFGGPLREAVAAEPFFSLLFKRTVLIPCIKDRKTRDHQRQEGKCQLLIIGEGKEDPDGSEDRREIRPLRTRCSPRGVCVEAEPRIGLHG